MSAEPRPIARWRSLSEPPAVGEARSRELAWWGMVFLIATEATLFGVFLVSYFYLRWQETGGWPPTSPDPALSRATPMTAVLVASALTMWLAVRAAGLGQRGRLLVMLAATLAAAGVFLGLQIWDWSEAAEVAPPTEDASSSLFFLLTGAHVAHLLLGMAFLAWIGVRGARGAYGPGRSLGVRVVALYWYFIAVLAVLVYVVAYLSPRW